MPAKKRPIANSGIMEIDAYVAGKSSIGGEGGKSNKAIEVFKLSSNETPLGASMAARLAFMRWVQYLHEYPPDSLELRKSIGLVYGLEAERIVCGGGSDELLALLCQAYLGKGAEAIYSQYGFLMYRINILASGAKPIIAKEKNFTADVDAIIKCINKKTKIIFLANPNNPTGTYLPEAELRRLHKALPPEILLVVDEAYGEYMQAENYLSAAQLVRENENVVMVRTFSKIYGLAALRIGWLYAPAHIVDAVNRTRGPFNVNSAALAAAQGAVGDQEHIKKAVRHNEKWRGWVSAELARLGLSVIPSYGNFVLIQFPKTGKKSADKADAYLMKKGYILRRLNSYGFSNALRMTIGTRRANEGVIATLEEFLHD